MDLYDLDDFYILAAKIIQFFNKSEDISTILRDQHGYVYGIPFNDKTAKVSILDLIKFIRTNIEETNNIVTEKPTTSRILGCTGTDICANRDEILEKISSKDGLVNTVFEFYDLVSRLKAEMRDDYVKTVVEKFNYDQALKQFEKDFNYHIDSLENLKKHFKLIKIKGSPMRTLREKRVLKDYQRFVADTISIFDHLQQMEILYKAFEFTSKLYQDKENVNVIKEAYEVTYDGTVPILQEIKKSIQEDNSWIMQERSRASGVAQISRIAQDSSQWFVKMARSVENILRAM